MIHSGTDNAAFDVRPLKVVQSTAVSTEISTTTAYACTLTTNLISISLTALTWPAVVCAVAGGVTAINLFSFAANLILRFKTKKSSQIKLERRSSSCKTSPTRDGRGERSFEKRASFVMLHGTCWNSENFQAINYAGKIVPNSPPPASDTRECLFSSLFAFSQADALRD